MFLFLKIHIKELARYLRYKIRAAIIANLLILNY